MKLTFDQPVQNFSSLGKILCTPCQQVKVTKQQSDDTLPSQGTRLAI